MVGGTRAIGKKKLTKGNMRQHTGRNGKTLNQSTDGLRAWANLKEVVAIALRNPKK